MNSENFGKQLKEYRKKHHLTQYQLAEKMHISGGHVSALERSEKSPKMATVRAFQALEEADDWDRFAIIKELTDREFIAYMNLWRRMRRLGPEKERQVLHIFLNILALL